MMMTQHGYGGGAVGGGGGAFGAGDGFEDGEDPELAMVLRITLEEHRARVRTFSAKKTKQLINKSLKSLSDEMVFV